MKKSNSLGLIIKFILYAVVVILAAWGWFGDKPGLTLNLGYVLLALTILLVLVFFLVSFIDNPKKSLLSLVALLVIGVVFLIAYTSASPVSLSKIEVSEAYTKFVGATLTLLYIVGGVAIVSIVLGQIYSLLK